MINTGLKTFAYSFVFSLFAIFAANKTLCRPADMPEKSLPHSNISAFLKASPAAVTNHKAKVKKITLIKEDKPQQPAEIKVESTDIQLVAKSTPQEKPQVVEMAQKEQPQRPAKKERIIAALEKVELPALNKPQKTSASKPKKINATKSKTFQTKTASAEKAPLDLLSQKQPEPRKNPPVKIAQKEEHKDLLLIPLQRDNRKIAGIHEKIKINSDEAQKQVAMLDFDKPIKSVVAETENKANSLKGELKSAEAEQWVPMAQKKGEITVKREADEIYDVSKVEIPEERPEIKISVEEAEPQEASKESESEAMIAPDKNQEQDDDKWIAAKGTKFPVNQNVLEQEYYKQAQDTQKITEVLTGEPKDTKKNEVKVAGEVVQNILIPIPEEIVNDKNLMPQLVSDPANKKLEEDLLQKEKGMLADSGEEIPFIAENKDTTPTEEKESANNKGLLNSLSSLFSTSETESKKATSQSASNQKNDVPGKILPTEIRLSFQPNRAEISGKTLDWIQAFANKTKENEHTVLEIRLDGTSSFELQQKRLNLLYNILTNLGLDYKKVNTVFTNREPNSFVLRVVNRSERTDDMMSPVRAMYYKKW